MNSFTQTNTLQNGQTLVTLLFFMVIAITVTAGAVIVVFVSAQGQTKVQQSQVAYYTAESGMENALMQLLRNPTYTGEQMTIGEGTAAITATMSGSVASGTITATSAGTVGTFVRKVQVNAKYTNNVLSVQSWKEIF